VQLNAIEHQLLHLPRIKKVLLDKRLGHNNNDRPPEKYKEKIRGEKQAEYILETRYSLANYVKTYFALSLQ